MNNVTDPSSFVCIVVDAQVAMYTTAISEFVCCCCLAALITHLPVDCHAEKPLFESLWVLRSAPGWPVVHQDMRNAINS